MCLAKGEGICKMEVCLPAKEDMTNLITMCFFPEGSSVNGCTQFKHAKCEEGRGDEFTSLSSYEAK